MSVGKWFIAGVLLLIGLQARAAAEFDTTSPIGFFTNVANKLLANAGYGFNASGIQIYPTNLYTADVHRMFQVAANIYDSVKTNRAYNGQVAANGFPSVFRPLFFTPDVGQHVYISGFAEVTNDVSSLTRARVRDLSKFRDRENVGLNDIVAGVPVVVAARRGFPNFNEFSMQTEVYVSRLLEFRRPNPLTSPVNQTNQMFVAAITNFYGVEAWNSYSNPYPRNLELISYLEMTALITNEVGGVVFSNNVSRAADMTIAGGSWSGWLDAAQAGPSFKIPFGQVTNNFQFLTNSTYRQSTKTFSALTHTFEQNTGFDTPVWLLNLRSRVRVVLVDTDANRIVDFVNFDHSEPTLDLAAKLRSDGDCHAVTPSTYNNIGSQWCTNRNLGNPVGPTYGILNQIGIGLSGTTDSRSFAFDQVAGSDPETAVDGFRYNLMNFSPIYPKDQGAVFYKSNIFYAPFAPYRPIFVRTKWLANDPLVHYTIGDLRDPSIPDTNLVNFVSDQPALANIGSLNLRYSPWGGNPYRIYFGILDYDLSAKDPLVVRPDQWVFMTNQNLSQAFNWLCGVHRGTPWQTLYLKSSAVNPVAWQKWVGTPDPAEAHRMEPTNDWRAVTLLSALFSTNDPRSLASINQPDAAAWRGVLDGMVAYSNGAPTAMASNSPQAALIAAALNTNRLGQPQGLFRQVADLLATPQLTVASPWVGPATASDADLEAIPSQLLNRLRPDSIGAVAQTDGVALIQFTGADAYSYAIEASSNLLDWVAVATNIPLHGIMTYSDEIQPGVRPRFFRTELSP